MPYLDNIAFSMECQAFAIENPILDKERHTLNFHARSRNTIFDIFCPHCNSHHVHQNKIYTRAIRGVPFTPGIQTTIHTDVKSFECQDCKKVFSEEIPFLYPGTRITNSLARWVKELLPISSITSISKLFNINWETVKGIHKELITTTLRQRRSQQVKDGYRPRYLGVDEFAIHKGHRYATVVMDLETGEVLWVGKDRTIEAFTKFFDEIEKELLCEVVAIAMDMNASYNKVCQQRLPGAVIVYDRYHMESNYSRDVMGAVRLDEARKYQEMSKDGLLDKETQNHLKKQYTTLKKARWLLLSKGRSRLNDDGTWESDDSTLNHILNNHQDIAVCYALKEEMSAMYSIADEKEAAMRWSAWFKAAEESEIPALARFARNKKDRLPGLIAHAKFRITTSKVEGTNNKIKVLKRVAYGFRDDEYFFNLIRYSTIPKKSLFP